MIPFFQPASKEAGTFQELLAQLGKPRVQLSKRPQSPHDWADLLVEQGIRSMVVQLEPEHLAEVELPMLAYFHQQPSPVIVEYISEGFVQYCLDNEERYSESIEDFSKKWTGLSVIISTEDSFPLHSNLEVAGKKKPIPWEPWALGAGVIALLIGAFHADMLLGMGFLLKGLGVLIGFGLLALHERTAPSWLNRLCHIREGAKCEEVLDKNPFPITSLPLPELNLVYFAGGFAALLLSWVVGDWDGIGGIIAWLALGGVAVSLYTLAYQALVIKQYCPLCLASTALIWAEAYLWSDYLWTQDLPGGWGLVAFAAAAVSLVVTEKKRNLEQSQALEHWRRFSEELRQDAKVFAGMISVQPRLEEPLFAQELVWGCEEFPEKEIILVTNPYCQPCQQMHSIWEKLAWEFGDRHRFRMRFSQQSEVGIACLALASVGEQEAWQQALHDWMSNPNSRAWQRHQRFKLLPSERELGEEALKKHIEWAERQNIAYTPTIFVDDLQLPELYSLEDLRRHL